MKPESRAIEVRKTSGGPRITPSGDTRFCQARTIGALSAPSIRLTANAIQISRQIARMVFHVNVRDSSVSCSTGVSGRGANQRDAPQMRTKTQRNDNWQPMVNTSVGLA